MNPLDRRQFLQISTSALVAAADRGAAKKPAAARIFEQNGTLRASGKNYEWEWVPASDQFRLFDAKGRLIAPSTLQPLVTISPVGNTTIRRTTPGKFVSHAVEAGAVTFYYNAVNGHARLSTRWRFEDEAIRVDPIIYETPLAEDVISLRYFGDAQKGRPIPALKPAYLIDPGISEGSSISPIVRSGVRLDTLSWLGHGDVASQGLLQQWGLPVHFFCGFNIDEHDGIARDAYTTGRSDAFCCGLTELPCGDLYVHLKSGAASLMMNYRSDLWGHLRGPGRMSLGAGLFWAFGSSYYEAIQAYYLGLLNAGIIHKKQNPEKKTAIALTPQYCCWGAQVDRGKEGDRQNGAFVREIYRELKDSGMRAGMFSIDDKWEGHYGTLKASSERFPHFIEFLDEVRADGRRIGLWSALFRCEDPAEIGLTTENMLRLPDGKPYKAGGGRYYILDFTQPKVERVFRNIVQDFMRRYNPDLVKFDFGYELPRVDVAAPEDRRYAGERLLKKGLEVVVGAMREVNPDIVLMYYQLSPLFLDELDLHSPDDLFLCSGEYDLEANRRFFFSSLLGELGVPTYGSSGYDWQSSPNIWFDSAVVGTLGSLNDFQGDEQGEKSTPQRIAKYNGLTHVLRSSNIFHVIPLDVDSEAPTRGAHSRSWARFENGQLVLLAIRPAADVDGAYSESRVTERQARDGVRTTVPVIVASRTSDGIESASSLGVVPYGDGEVSIRRQSAGEAEVTEHWFDGTTTSFRTKLRDGYCHLRTKTQGPRDAPLEWMEVRFLT